MAERLLWEQEAVSSNLITPTTVSPLGIMVSGGLSFCVDVIRKWTQALFKHFGFAILARQHGARVEVRWGCSRSIPPRWRDLARRDTARHDVSA